MTQDNVPVKYTMGMWKSMPNYPTKLDVLYEVYANLFKAGKTEFSEQTLNSIWFNSAGAGSWKGTKTEILVQDLIKDGTFKESKTVNEKVWYVIDTKLNPFL